MAWCIELAPPGLDSRYLVQRGVVAGLPWEGKGLDGVAKGRRGLSGASVRFEKGGALGATVKVQADGVGSRGRGAGG
jgi:hypothetical protein